MGEDPHPFLLYDNGTDADERLLIFSTEEHLQLLVDRRHCLGTVHLVYRQCSSRSFMLYMVI